MFSFVKLTAIFFYHGIYFLRGRNGDEMKLRMDTELLREILRTSRLRNTGGGREGGWGREGEEEGGRRGGGREV